MLIPLFVPLLFNLCATRTVWAAAMPGGEALPAPLAQIVAPSLFEELPILLPGATSVEAAVTKPREASPQRLIPARRPRIGGAPRVRRPEDPTALTMFGSGLVLFTLSWICASWQRRSSTYTRPLFQDEEVPRPRPPHLIFSLTRILLKRRPPIGECSDSS